MGIEEAAKKLAEKLRPSGLLLTVGVGSGNIYVYAAKKPKQLTVLAGEFFEGFPVIVKRAGVPKTSS